MKLSTQIFTAGLLSLTLSGCAGSFDDLLGNDVDKHYKMNNLYVNNDDKSVAFRYGNDGKLSEKHYFSTSKRVNLLKIERFHSTGNLSEIILYKNGIANGLAKSYFENGDLKTSVLLKNDKPHGTEKHFWENGVLKLSINYNFGVLEGTTTLYTNEGRKWAEANFTNGKPIGKEKVYFESGMLNYTTDFEDGILRQHFITRD